MIKSRSWEYWPFQILYTPIFIYWLFLSLRARSFLFFSASNPSIQTGGMLGESKMEILRLIPERYLPKTIYINPEVENVTTKFQLHGFNYPVICKPDVGERGKGVAKINTSKELLKYSNKAKWPFLIQEYIDAPIELGIFYYRYPNTDRGTISSIVMKEMLHVVGNGKDTLRTLICNLDRAKIHRRLLFEKFAQRLNEVIPAAEKIELVEIGNHCKGTKFLNANHLINDELITVFDQISKKIQGFYYGRYDLRVHSLNDLYAGDGITIMELNGAGSEPAHIYHPGYSLLAAYRCLFEHWTVLFRISKQNHENGIPYLTLKEGWSVFKQLQT